jgi:predicted nucleic acid-binding protein
MIPYLDTSALVRLYYPEVGSEKIAHMVAGSSIVYTRLHALELHSAIWRKTYRGETSPGMARKCLSLVAGDLASGVLVRPRIDMDEVWDRACNLADRHCPKLGCRSLDVLHVAHALALGCKVLATADERQRVLAGRAGLRVA